MAKQTISFTEYRADGEEIEHELPAHFEICPSCDGCATDRGRSVECDGGGFTASEWADQDCDFRDDYLSGVYDRPCDECSGTPGRVLVIDRDACNPAILALFDKDADDEYDYQRMCEAERHMGA